MKKKLIAIGLVAALAVPTAAIAAHHESHKDKANTSASRSGLAFRAKPSKTVPVGGRTRSATKPKAGAKGRKAHASAARSGTTVRTRRNRTTGTAPAKVTINNGGNSGASGSGTPGLGSVGGLGDIQLPISVGGQ
jgi:hypothetical protein